MTPAARRGARTTTRLTHQVFELPCMGLRKSLPLLSGHFANLICVCVTYLLPMQFFVYWSLLPVLLA